MQESTIREFLGLVIEKATTACWSWAGKYDDDGRPVFRGERAYRYAYRIYIGPIPYGYDIHHTCENSKCVNSKHLVALPAEVHQQVHAYLRAGNLMAAEHLYRRARLGEFSPATHPNTPWPQVDPAFLAQLKKARAVLGAKREAERQEVLAKDKEFQARWRAELDARGEHYATTEEREKYAASLEARTEAQQVELRVKQARSQCQRERRQMWAQFYREAHSNITAQYDLETQKQGKFRLFLTNFFGDGAKRKAWEIGRKARAQADEATRQWEEEQVRKALNIQKNQSDLSPTS